MGWITHLAIYFIVWWITLFLVLPFGVQRDEAVSRGNDPGAPARSRIGIKLLVNTLLALIVWFVIFLIDRLDLITIRDFGG
jgi:predicted secreted protein